MCYSCLQLYRVALVLALALLANYVTGFVLHDPAIRTLASLVALTDLQALLQPQSDLSHLSCTWQRLQLLSTSPQNLLCLPRSPSLRLIDSEMRWTLPGSSDPKATAQQVKHAAELLVSTWDGATLYNCKQL